MSDEDLVTRAAQHIMQGDFMGAMGIYSISEYRFFGLLGDKSLVAPNSILCKEILIEI